MENPNSMLSKIATAKQWRLHPTKIIINMENSPTQATEQIN